MKNCFKIIPTLIGVILVLTTGCRTVKINNAPEKKGARESLTEISIEGLKNSTLIILFNNDIITERQAISTIQYIPELGKHHNWIAVSSPGQYSANYLLGKEGNTPLYLMPDKSLKIKVDDEGKISFDGELGEINSILFNAPRFEYDKKIKQKLSKDSLYLPGEAKKEFDNEFIKWEKDLKEYTAHTEMPVETKMILESMPKFRKGAWILENESYLGLNSREDYEIIEQILKENDSSMAMHHENGILPILLVRSELLNRFEDRTAEKEAGLTLKQKFRSYFRRYDGLLQFLGITGMPEILQLAVARTLCAEGMLELAGNKEDAIEIIDYLKDYLPNKEIREIVEEYAGLLFNEGEMEVPENDGGKVLDSIISKYKGKNIVLDFWGPRCGPCLDEMQKTRDKREESRGNDNWVVVYVTTREMCTPEEYEKVVSGLLNNDESYYLSHLQYGPLAGIFKVSQIPRQVLIGRDGKIRSKHYKINFEELKR